MSDADLSRRTLLLGAAVLPLAPLLGTMPAASQGLAAYAGELVLGEVAAAPLLPVWLVGTPGEFDWSAVRAHSAQEAFDEWAAGRWGCDTDDWGSRYDDEYVRRVPEMDDLESVAPADWLRAGYGHCCSRCGYETSADSEALACRDEAVCEECQTEEDRMLWDSESAAERLADELCNAGVAATAARLRREDLWRLADSTGVWARACVVAAGDMRL